MCVSDENSGGDQINCEWSVSGMEEGYCKLDAEEWSAGAEAELYMAGPSGSW